MTMLRSALILSVAGAALALGTAPVEAADNKAVCGGWQGEYDEHRSDASYLRDLEPRVRIECSELRAQIAATLRNLRRGGGTPGDDSCPQPVFANAILAGTDRAALRQLRDTCERERSRAIERLRALATGGSDTQSSIPALEYNVALPGQIEEGARASRVENLLYDQYRIRLRSGDRIAVTMQTESFAPLLAVVTGNLASEYQVQPAEFREESDGRVILEFTAPDAATVETDASPEAQDYMIVAISRDADPEGPGPHPYSIEWRAPPPPEPPQPLPQAREVQFGAAVQSAVTEESPTLRDRGSSTYYEPWGFRGTAGEGVSIYMDAEYDAFLSLGRVEGGVFTEVASNDDGGDGLDSLIIHRLEQDGDYVIRARALGGYAGGAYTLNVQRLTPQQRERVPQNADTWLLDGVLLSGAGAYQEFEFRPRRNRRYTVSVSGNINPIIDLGLAGRGSEVREVDFYPVPVESAPADAAPADPAAAPADPAAPGTTQTMATPSRDPQRLEFRANEGRPYIIRVRDASDGGGSFSLTISEIE
jgi:hypothetical protein